MYKNKLEWRLIPGYEGRYSVSNYGRVKRHFRYNKSKILKPSAASGYFSVSLSIRNKLSYHRVHGLVMLCFVSKRPIGMTINHKDGNKLNNKLSNLEYMSMIDNLRHAAELGLMSTSFKLNTIIIRKIREEYSKGKVKQYELARKYNVDQALISRIVNMKIWRKD